GPGGVVDRARVDARDARGFERVPDGRDLRFREDDARYVRAVGERVELRIATEDRVGGDPPVVLAHVRQQRAAVDVADRVQPVGAVHAERLVDLDVAAWLEPDRLEAEVARRG